jgi:hypothetical protein
MHALTVCYCGVHGCCWRHLATCNVPCLGVQALHSLSCSNLVIGIKCKGGEMHSKEIKQAAHTTSANPATY